MSRAHDLPPKWDGYPVEWIGEWMQVWTTHALHAPLRDLACEKCGSLETRLTKRGQVATVIGAWNLHVSRCPDCGHDTVYDLLKDESWDLDDTDYGPDGSYSETDLQGELF